MIVLAILLYGFATIEFLAGFRLIKKNTNENTLAKIKKRLIVTSCCVVSIVAVLISINNIFLKEQRSIKIYDVNSIKLLQENNKNYIIINNEKLVLSCGFSEYSDIWDIKVTDGKAIFNIQYEWNVLYPDKGKIVEMEILK
ncbi:hypothetical protein PV797_14530 [Clostridiaceae bacterium M8S5]|nr:hypothetical protein PV797_14530 [Clostridiaceae bacterium M8S5]